MYLIFPLLSLLAYIASHIATGPFIWLSFLTLGIWEILAGNLIQGLISLAIGKRRKAILPLLAILLHSDFIFAIWQPPFHCKDITGDKNKELTLITYNCSHFYWTKLWTMNEAAREIEKINPDILCLQEAPSTDYYHQDSINKAFDYLPYKIQSYRTDHLPIAIYSRYPITPVDTIYYKDSPNLSIIADIDINGKKIRIINNHFQTTSVNAHRGFIMDSKMPLKSRLRELKLFLYTMKENYRKRTNQVNFISKEIENSPYPVLVCGDFNDIPSSYTYKTIQKSLTDSFWSAGSGYQYTFRYLFKILRIDYIFHSKDFKAIRSYSLEYPYSDHNMVVWEGRLSV